MTISIELRPEEERALLERARKSGRDISQYVHQVLAEHIRSGQGSEAASKTFDEILAPVREGWRQGGMSEEEITALFEETRDEVRRERRAQGDAVSQGGLPGVVFDTMILYQATANVAGPAAELLRQLEAGQFVLFVSDEILDEARDVLSRPKLRAKNQHVTDETVQQTFELLGRLARTVSNGPACSHCPETRTMSLISIWPSPRTPITS